MKDPDTFYDWEQNFKRKTKKRVIDPKESRILNSIDLPHELFKNYMKLWKSENLKKED